MPPARDGRLPGQMRLHGDRGVALQLAASSSDSAITAQCDLCRGWAQGFAPSARSAFPLPPPSSAAMVRSWAWIAAVCVALCVTAAAGSCEGGSCAEQTAAARAAGLLGSSGASNGCTPKQYPETGALGVVSCRRCCRLPPAGTHLASRRIIKIWRSSQCRPPSRRESMTCGGQPVQTERSTTRWVLAETEPASLECFLGALPQLPRRLPELLQTLLRRVPLLSPAPTCTFAVHLCVDYGRGRLPGRRALALRQQRALRFVAGRHASDRSLAAAGADGLLVLLLPLLS